MSGRRWIAFVVLLLAGHVTAMTIMAVASGSPASRIVPDYYRRAVDWDRTAAARDASLRLGWTVAPRLIALGDGRSRLELEVRDAGGHPLAGARAEVDLRHQSRATGESGIALAEVEPGRYVAVVATSRPGVYVTSVALERGVDRWVGDATVEREAGP